MNKRIIIPAISILVLIVLIFAIRNFKEGKTPIVKGPGALIAIVIDDWGYNTKNLETILEIDVPLTISILPRLYFSKDVLEQVKKRGDFHDILLHLPLESKSGNAAEKNTIKTDMEKEDIVKILTQDIDSLPGLSGISNHQGSKATEDVRLMAIIFDELKKRDLFFLDSITSPRSVCTDLARKVGIKSIERDVFLDITDQTDKENFEVYVKGQMRELISIALKKGRAVGIGHNIDVTFKVIEDAIPELEKKGIRVVPLSELVR
ncbi:MAG: divergent polysaccharide deacetylase family protein [Candidatus Omnitrophota bacterium]